MLAVIGGNAVANNVVTQAAYNFYSVLAVRTPALNVARVIDAEMDKAVQTAQAALSKLTPPASMDPNVRQKNPADAKYIALHTALVRFHLCAAACGSQALTPSHDAGSVCELESEHEHAGTLPKGTCG